MNRIAARHLAIVFASFAVACGGSESGTGGTSGDEEFELVIALASGAGVTNLSGPLVAGGAVTNAFNLP